MRCFCCAKEIVELPEGSPERKAIEQRIEKEDYAFCYRPSFIIEVIEEEGNGPCRCAIVCWPCIVKIEPDMWESDRTWVTYNPAVPFNKLPIYNHEVSHRDDPDRYAPFQPPPKE